MRAPCLTYVGREGFDRSLISETKAILNDRAPDIVQTHNYRPTTIAALLRITRVPWKWVAFFHGYTTESFRVRAYNLLDNVLMRTADQIVVVSESQIGRYRFHGYKVKVINNAILSAGFDPKGTYPEVNALENSLHPKLVVIGRLSSEKGVDVFLHAAARMKNPFSAAIVGNGIDRKKLEFLRDELGLSDRVSFIGRLDPIEAAYQWCDLVVIPSRSEGMPNVLLEAILHSRHVVATDVGSVKEIIGDTAIGEIVPPQAPEELAAAIDRILQGPLDTTEDMKVDRAKALDRYSIKSRVAAHLSLYREVFSI